MILELINILRFVGLYTDTPGTPFWARTEDGRRYAQVCAVRMLQLEKMDLRKEALAVLSLLTGEQFGDDPKACIKWHAGWRKSGRPLPARKDLLNGDLDADDPLVIEKKRGAD